MYYSVEEKEKEKEFILDRFLSKNHVILLTKEEFIKKYSNYGGKMIYTGRELENKMYKLKKIYFSKYKNKIVVVDDEFLKNRKDKQTYLEYLKKHYFLDNIKYCIDNYERLKAMSYR